MFLYLIFYFVGVILYSLFMQYIQWFIFLNNLYKNLWINGVINERNYKIYKWIDFYSDLKNTNKTIKSETKTMNGIQDLRKPQKLLEE